LKCRIILFVSVILIISATPLVNVYAITEPCMYPTAWFASEVVLNKPGVQYDLSLIREMNNVTNFGVSVIYRSHFNESVAVILTPINVLKENGLDLRIQIPTEQVFTDSQYVTYFYNDSSTRVSDLNLMGGRPYRWLLEQSFSPLYVGGPPMQISNLTKGNLKISIIPNLNETTPGTLIQVSAENTQKFTNQNLTELRMIFDSIGYPISFKEFQTRAQLTDNVMTTRDLDSAIGLDPQQYIWTKAMRTELEWLQKNRVIRGLIDEDLDRLSEIAPRAWGDHNLKARYFNGEWLLGITEEMIEAEYTQQYQGEPDCDGFPLSAMPTGILGDFNSSFSILYLITDQSFEGAAIRVAAVVVAALLIVIALLYIRSRRKSRDKKITHKR